MQQGGISSMHEVHDLKTELLLLHVAFAGFMIFLNSANATWKWLAFWG